jgi:hypothetical protein
VQSPCRVNFILAIKTVRRARLRQIRVNFCRASTIWFGRSLTLPSGSPLPIRLPKIVGKDKSPSRERNF